MSEKILFGITSTEVIDKFHTLTGRTGSLAQAITHLLNRDGLLRRKYRFRQSVSCVVWEEVVDHYGREKLSVVLQMLDSYVRFNRLDSRAAALEELLNASEIVDEELEKCQPSEVAREEQDESTQTTTAIQQRQLTYFKETQTTPVLYRHATTQTNISQTVVMTPEQPKRRKRVTQPGKRANQQQPVENIIQSHPSFHSPMAPNQQRFPFIHQAALWPNIQRILQRPLSPAQVATSTAAAAVLQDARTFTQQHQQVINTPVKIATATINAPSNGRKDDDKAINLISPDRGDSNQDTNEEDRKGVNEQEDADEIRTEKRSRRPTSTFQIAIHHPRPNYKKRGRKPKS